MRILTNLLAAIPALAAVMFVHEYGHFVMLRKLDIGVQELSLGIGPVIYQKKYSTTSYRLRAIPIFAYNLMSKEGVQKFKTLSFSKKALIRLAGVANNLIAGIGTVLTLNLVGWRRGFITGAEFLTRTFTYPLKLFPMFFLFLLDTFTLRRFNLASCKFSTSRTEPPGFIHYCIYYNFLLGFVNLLPIYILDGGILFEEAIKNLVSEQTLAIYRIVSLPLLFFFLLIFGVSKNKFVDYEN